MKGVSNKEETQIARVDFGMAKYNPFARRYHSSASYFSYNPCAADVGDNSGEQNVLRANNLLR